ncbi:ribonuclease H-like domain-containing protein [Tanacetum coccineum]
MVVGDDINKTGDDANKNHDNIGSSSELNLSFKDTLYLHSSSDTGGSPIVTIKLTGIENYKMWSIAMTFALRNHNKLGIIDGSCKRDNKNLALANQWDMCKSVVVTWILNSLSPDLFAGAIYAKTAYEIHTVDRYFELVGYPVGYVKRNFKANTIPISSNNASVDVQSNNVSSNNATTNNSHVSLSNEQLARLMSLLIDNGVSTANANMANISNLGLIVGHPNGTQALITKIGDLKINNDITLYDVLIVLEYTVSLLSIHKHARDSKLFVGFDESKCYIQDLRANKTVGIDNQCNGLYLFDIDYACKIVSNSSIASCYVSKILWHQRLGHPVDQVLHVLKTALNLDGHYTSDHLSDTCNKAKQTTEPFLFSDHKSTKIGQLVHLDVWGPYKVVSRDGFRYFLTIVDDFSRAIWVYMLKGKDDVYDSIVSNDNSEATSLEENNTHLEGNVSDETDLVGDFYENSEFNSEIADLSINTVRRSSRQTKLPTSVNDFIIDGKIKFDVERVVNYANLSHENFCFISGLNKSIEPTCYNDVILDNNWIDAMHAEIEALNKNHTWIITDLPTNRKPIGYKLIFKIKYKANGEIKRYKARLVAKKFNQREGIDFDETFSPVVKISTIRCLIALSIKNKWSLFQLDVNNALLYRDLEEHVYMTIPQGFSDKYNKNKVCKLVKSLYGLKQAPKKWNEKLVSVLKDNGFYGLLGCKPVSTPMEPNSILSYIATSDVPLLDSITGKDIKYIHSDCENNLKGYSDADWAKLTLPVDRFCDNKSALQLTINPVFHERFRELASGLLVDRELTSGIRALVRRCGSESNLVKGFLGVRFSSEQQFLRSVYWTSRAARVSTLEGVLGFSKLLWLSTQVIENRRGLLCFSFFFSSVVVLEKKKAKVNIGLFNNIF